MFYYYGAKHRLAQRYPPPAHRTIVEPFAGAAGYAMAHLDEVDQVILIEKDPRVVDLWTRLLHMTPDEVLALPMPHEGDRTTDFLVMTCATSNAMARATSLKVTSRVVREYARMLRRIARHLEHALKISVECGGYEQAPDIEATWFIDPPYQIQGLTSRTQHPKGMGYAKGCQAIDLNYQFLGQWCRQRRGQVIVAESLGADWLPFKPLRQQQNSGGSQYIEAVWHQCTTAVDLIDWDLRCNDCGVLLFPEDDYYVTEDDRAYCADCWETR